MFDQILAGKRQTGKTTWLVERAMRDVANRESSSLIVVIGHNAPATKHLVQRTGERIHHPALRIVDGYNHNPGGFRGLTLNVEHVIILVDEIQLFNDDVADIVDRVKTTIIPCCPSRPTFYIYGTNNIEETQ